MKNLAFFTTIFSMVFLFNNCNNKQAGQPVANGIDTAGIRAEIFRIAKMHSDTILMSSEQGRQKIASGFEDSVMVIDNAQVSMGSGNFLAHDLYPGSINIPEDVKYRFFSNNTVMITFSCKLFYLFEKDTVFHTGREIDVFVKHNNHWKLSYIGFSPSHVSYFKASNYPKSNPALYPAYSGVYQQSAKEADTILLIDGNLYASNTSDPRRYKLFSTNDSTFMAEGFPERMIFGKGKNGRITHYTLEFQDGQRRNFPKVK
jgi:hypothetical protein